MTWDETEVELMWVDFVIFIFFFFIPRHVKSFPASHLKGEFIRIDKAPCGVLCTGQMRSWSCSGLWRATSWAWCQWTSVTTEPSLPPAPSMRTSVSGTWSLENRSSPWTPDQVGLIYSSIQSCKQLIWLCLSSSCWLVFILSGTDNRFSCFLSSSFLLLSF